MTIWKPRHEKSEDYLSDEIVTHYTFLFLTYADCIPDESHEEDIRSLLSFWVFISRKNQQMLLEEIKEVIQCGEESLDSINDIYAEYPDEESFEQDYEQIQLETNGMRYMLNILKRNSKSSSDKVLSFTDKSFKWKWVWKRKER